MKKKPSQIKALLISDIQGKDDEGMKKIARMLVENMSMSTGVEAAIASPKEGLSIASSYDILHYIGGPTYRSVLFAGLIKLKSRLKGRSIKTVLTFTNPFWGKRANVLVRLFKPDHLVVMSKHWQTWAQKRNLEHSFLSLSGVSTEKFRPVNEEEHVRLKALLALPCDKLIALHVGHLKPDRNLTLLVEAQRDPNVQVVIVGSTTTVSSASLISQLKTAGCIIIDEYQPNIEHFYQASDCYMFPTVDPKAAVQVPLSILEAMASALPVVSTPFGGLPSLFVDKEDLFFISKDEVAQGGLVEKIRLAAKSKPVKEEKIASHSWENISQQVEALYRKLCPGK